MDDVFSSPPGPNPRGFSCAASRNVQHRLAKARVQIETEAPGHKDLMFNSSLLCQVGLPRSAAKGREFLRRSGDAWILVQAGFVDEGRGPVEQPIPYGAIPRLALAWISTYAVRHKTRHIPIGRSASEFLRSLGLNTDGKRHAAMRRQMHALAACRLQMGFRGRTVNADPIQRFDAWLAHDDQQLPLWPGELVLSQDYYAVLSETAVPLDRRALLAIKQSALALDIYFWLAQRLHRLEQRALILRWHQLREQFAQEYTGPHADKNFKKKFRPALQKVLAVYPKARVKIITGGICLHPSPPPIPRR